MRDARKPVGSIGAAKSLESIIERLEKWQAKHATKDETGRVRQAKSLLVDAWSRIAN